MEGCRLTTTPRVVDFSIQPTTDNLLGATTMQTRPSPSLAPLLVILVILIIMTFALVV